MTVIARLHNNNILSILGNVTETGGMTTKTFDFTQESLGAFSHAELSTFFYPSTGWVMVDKEVESGKGIERALEDYFTGNYYYNMYGMGYTLPSGVTELDIVATVARSANVGVAILFGNNQGYVTTINGLVYRKDDTTPNNTSLITLGSATNKTNTNTWYKTRVKWDSTGAIKLKIWDVDTSEPSTWDVEVTDTTYSNPQVAGVHHYQRGSYGWFKDLSLTFNEDVPVRLENNGDLIVANLYKNNNFVRIDRGNLYVNDLIEGTLEDIPLFSATGGIETTDSTYKYHTYNSDGSFVVTGTKEIEVLIVAGGGSGGASVYGGGGSGGGGAGGLIYSLEQVSDNTYQIVVGDGGQAPSTGSGVQGNNGENSTAFGLTAIGGGGGGSGSNNTTATGKNGGSGGGGGFRGYNTVANGGSGTTGQGNDGSGVSSVSASGAGGGGAGSQGNPNTGTGGGVGGIGGSGLSYFGNTYALGGNGGESSTLIHGNSNTGNGGSGAYGGGTPGASGNGGSGVVIIRYEI